MYVHATSWSLVSAGTPLHWFSVLQTSGCAFLHIVQWFFDSVSAGVCLPEDGYVVTPPPPPAEPGLAVVYSQPWAVALNKFEPSVGLSNTLLKGCQVSGTFQLVMPRSVEGSGICRASVKWAALAEI